MILSNTASKVGDIPYKTVEPTGASCWSHQQSRSQFETGKRTAMPFFGRRSTDLPGRVTALLKADRAAQASGRDSTAEAVRVDAWQLQQDLAELMSERDPRLAQLLFEASRISLFHEFKCGDYPQAMVCARRISAATTDILHGVVNGFYKDQLGTLRRLTVRVQGLSEIIIQAAFLSEQGFAAVTAVETVSMILFGFQMNTVCMHLIEEKIGRDGDYSRLESYADELKEVWPRTPEREVDSGNTDRGLECVLKEISLPSLDGHAEQFLLTSPAGHAARAAQLTGRTLLYLAAGVGERSGVAQRVCLSQENRASIEMTELPALGSASAKELASAIRAAVRKIHLGEVSGTDDNGSLLMTLKEVGKRVWLRILNTWPDILSSPLAVVPLGLTSQLPLYTAIVNDLPICSGADITIVPSATMLHFSSLPFRSNKSGSVFIGADPWYGPDAIPQTLLEAQTVAEVYGRKPLLHRAVSNQEFGETSRVFRGDQRRTDRSAAVARKLAGLMREVSTVHLACHGVLDLTGPFLFFEEPVALDEIHQSGGFPTFSGWPVIVLSACELGGSVEENIPAEQWGFPAGLLAMGARAVVGPSWPVPDTQDTIDLMKNFHLGLGLSTSAAALGKIIGDAYKAGVSPQVWGSFAHYGT
jgi:hypothetical protein